MDLIRELQEKFQNLDAKLNSNVKVESIRRVHSKDLERIYKCFDSKQQKYENGFNKCRGEMLDQLIQTRNGQLKKCNDFMENRDTNNEQKNLFKIKNLNFDIKRYYAQFGCSIISIFDTILCRNKFKNFFNLCDLVKYSKYMKIEEEINLEKFRADGNEYLSNFHVLPSNKYFLTSRIFGMIDDEDDDEYEGHEECLVQINMNILNKNGDLIKFNEFPSLMEFKENPGLMDPYRFKLNTTNIFVLDSYSYNLEIYDFNLDLVHSIVIYPFSNSFYICNYDLAFFHEPKQNNYTFHDILQGKIKSYITMFNYKTAKIKSQNIYLDESHFMKLCQNSSSNQSPSYFFLKFLNFNERFVFLEGYFPGNISLNTIFILNRNDNYNVFKSLTNINSFEWCKFYNSDMSY